LSLILPGNSMMQRVVKNTELLLLSKFDEWHQKLKEAYTENQALCRHLIWICHTKTHSQWHTFGLHSQPPMPTCIERESSSRHHANTTGSARMKLHHSVSWTPWKGFTMRNWT
jgi:hypothetical protein